MPELRIRNFPAPLRRRLAADARRHSRTLDDEIVDLLEKGLLLRSRAEEREAAGGHPFLLTRRWLEDAKRRGGSIRLSELSRRG